MATISVRLDAHTERTLARLSRRDRKSKSGVIREAILALAERTEGETTARSPYDAVADLIGCVQGGPPDLSERTGEKLARLLRARARRRK